MIETKQDMQKEMGKPTVLAFFEEVAISSNISSLVAANIHYF